MGGSNVLRVARTDSKSDESVIIRIVQANTDRLDLQIFGTDGEHVYVGKTRHSTVEKLQTKSFSGSLRQWQSVLAATLLHQADALADAIVDNVELAATVGDGLAIIVRKNIDGITQRLGEISLKLNDDEEISLFDWTAESAAGVTILQQERAELQKQIEQREQHIKTLQKQLQDAQEERNRHDKQLMLKFSQLLNSKKQKIRKQQRLLVKANIATSSDGADDDDDDNDGPLKLLPRNTPGKDKKRKAEDDSLDQQIKDESPEEEEDGDASTVNTSSSRQATPELDSSDEENNSTVPTAAQRKQAGPAGATNTSSTESKQLRIPPKRELPFGKRDEPASNGGKQGDEAEADEETDDEL
ncbi:hypothetical protein ANO11243_029230 [Dothideomycetidae sp. 11243]|nr:hypothetical protein ANO11243_029230 [fungal sp. No.11243]